MGGLPIGNRTTGRFGQILDEVVCGLGMGTLRRKDIFRSCLVQLGFGRFPNRPLPNTNALAGFKGESFWVLTLESGITWDYHGNSGTWFQNSNYE